MLTTPSLRRREGEKGGEYILQGGEPQ